MYHDVFAFGCLKGNGETWTDTKQDEIEINSTNKRMDNLLNTYYQGLGRLDYINQQNIGKFSQFMKEQFFDDLENELGIGQTAKDCLCTAFDPRFPIHRQIKRLIRSKNINEEEVIFYVLQQCYIYNKSPNENS